MSNHRFLTTLGQPYLAFVAEDIGDLSTLPTFGLAAVTAEFRVDRLPIQNAAADEIHPFFAFDHDVQTKAPILEVGITPSGRLKAQAKSGSQWQSVAGLFSDARRWNIIQIVYDGGTGVWDVTINGVEDANTVDGAPAYLLPDAGYNTRLMLMNGRDGLARSIVSVRDLSATFVGTFSNVAHWPFGERSGATVTPVVTTTNPSGVSELRSTPVLSARWYEPTFTHPWGAVPSQPTTGAYRWGLETDWTRRPKPTTLYTRVPA